MIDLVCYKEEIRLEVNSFRKFEVEEHEEGLGTRRCSLGGFIDLQLRNNLLLESLIGF